MGWKKIILMDFPVDVFIKKQKYWAQYTGTFDRDCNRTYSAVTKNVHISNVAKFVPTLFDQFLRVTITKFTRKPNLYETIFLRSFLLYTYTFHTVTKYILFLIKFARIIWRKKCHHIHPLFINILPNNISNKIHEHQRRDILEKLNLSIKIPGFPI